MYDFSKSKVRCSCIGYIMAKEGGKTPYELWQAALEDLATEEGKYEKIEKKDGKMAQNKMAKIEKIKESLIELEANKDEEVLTDGCKSYLTRLYAFEKYGKWSAHKDKGNKFTTKGKLAEGESIELLCQLDNKTFKKNEERIENEFLIGTPDLFEGENIYKAELIIDVKTSWDVESFFSNLGKPLKTMYWWQIQGYMAISGAQQGEVSFCLVNTPDSLLNDEKYKLFRQLDPVTDQDPNYLKAEVELINNLTFEDIPANERRIKFMVDRDDEAIEKLNKKVQKCREWLYEIERLHLNLDN